MVALKTALVTFAPLTLGRFGFGAVVGESKIENKTLYG